MWTEAANSPFGHSSAYNKGGKDWNKKHQQGAAARASETTKDLAAQQMHKAQNPRHNQP